MAGAGGGAYRRPANPNLVAFCAGAGDAAVWDGPVQLMMMTMMMTVTMMATATTTVVVVVAAVAVAVAAAGETRSTGQQLLTQEKRRRASF